MPPLMPAAKLRPVRPRTTTVPPVMYSQPWSPTPFDDRHGAAVADGEPLAGQAVDEHLAAGGAVEERVADDHVLLGIEGRAGRGLHDDPPAGEPLAQVVVGVAHQPQRDAAGEKRAEALAGRAAEGEFDRAVGQAVGRRAA